MKTEDKLLVYKTLLDVLRDDKSGDDNNTEDENITKIILHTQEHDVLGRQWTTDFKKIMNGLEENNISNSNKTHFQNVSNTEINIGCEQESEQEEY